MPSTTRCHPPVGVHRFSIQLVLYVEVHDPKGAAQPSTRIVYSRIELEPRVQRDGERRQLEACHRTGEEFVVVEVDTEGGAQISAGLGLRGRSGDERKHE